MKWRNYITTSQDDVMESNETWMESRKVMDTTSLGLGPFSRKRHQKFSVRNLPLKEESCFQHAEVLVKERKGNKWIKWNEMKIWNKMIEKSEIKICKTPMDQSQWTHVHK